MSEEQAEPNEGNRELHLEDICEKLDELSTEILELMQECVDCKAQLEEMQKAGYLKLAKARYVMGSNKVSAMQLPSEDGPDVSPRFRVVNVMDVTNETEELVLRSTDQDLQARVERTYLKHGPKFESEAASSIKLPKTSESDDGTDPLKWFGVMVPKPLKKAQSKFSATLPLIMHIANIEKKLNSKVKVYEEYMEQKNKLQSHK